MLVPPLWLLRNLMITQGRPCVAEGILLLIDQEVKNNRTVSFDLGTKADADSADDSFLEEEDAFAFPAGSHREDGGVHPGWTCPLLPAAEASQRASAAEAIKDTTCVATIRVALAKLVKQALQVRCQRCKWS